MATNTSAPKTKVGTNYTVTPGHFTTPLLGEVEQREGVIVYDAQEKVIKYHNGQSFVTIADDTLFHFNYNAPGTIDLSSVAIGDQLTITAPHDLDWVPGLRGTLLHNQDNYITFGLDEYNSDTGVFTFTIEHIEGTGSFSVWTADILTSGVLDGRISVRVTGIFQNWDALQAHSFVPASAEGDLVFLQEAQGLGTVFGVQTPGWLGGTYYPAGYYRRDNTNNEWDYTNDAIVASINTAIGSLVPDTGVTGHVLTKTDTGFEWASGAADTSNLLKLTGESEQEITGGILVDGGIDINAGSFDVYDGNQDIFRVSQGSHNVTIYDGNLNMDNGNIILGGGATVDGKVVSELINPTDLQTNLEIGVTTSGHVDHPNTAGLEAEIALGWDGRVFYRLPIDVAITSVAAEQFIETEVSGELPFQLSDTVQAGDNKPVTSAGVNSAGYQDATQVSTAITNALVGVGGEISAQATYSQPGVTVSEVSSENRITFADASEVATFIENIGFPLGNQSHTIAAGHSFNFEIVNDDGSFSYSIGQATQPTNLLYDTGDEDLDHISFPLAGANFNVARTGTIRTNLTEAAVENIVGGTNVNLTVNDKTLTINSTGGSGIGGGLEVVSSFSEITSPTNGQDVYLDTTDGTNQPGVYQYNGTTWVIVLGGRGVPFGDTLPRVAGTLGELFRLMQADGNYQLGFYVRIANTGAITDWRQLGEERGNGSFPTTNLYDGRTFYLEEHDTSGTNNDTPAWYVYREAAAATGTIGTDYQSATAADWYISGESIEATGLYPTLGDTTASVNPDTIEDVPHVEQFEVTPGIWTFDGVAYIYNGIAHDIDTTQDLWDGAPLEPGTTDTYRSGWQTWDAFVASKQNTLPSLGLGSMIVDARSSLDDPIRWVGFKPLLTGLDSDGNEAQLNWAVENATDNYQHHSTSKEWQEQAFAPITVTGGPLNGYTIEGSPVAGTTDVLKYTDTNELTWSADEGGNTGPFSAFTLSGSPSTTNSVPKWTDATTLTWSADTGGGDVSAIEAEVDAIQAHEDVLDSRASALEARVSNLEQTYGDAYTWAGNTVVNTLLTGVNRRDSQGANPSTVNNILNSEYNPDSNILRWWISPNSSTTIIDELIANATAIGFSDGANTPIPFVPIDRGENQEGTAIYIDFILQQEDTYESTLLSYADETEVVFQTTLHFYNTANTNFTLAQTDAGDHHRASVLTPTQEEDLTQIAGVGASMLLSTNAAGNIVGTTETGVPVFQTTINLSTDPSDLSGKGDTVQMAFRFGGSNTDPVEFYVTTNGGTTWGFHPISGQNTVSAFGDITASDEHGTGFDNTMRGPNNQDLWIDRHGNGRVLVDGFSVDGDEELASKIDQFGHITNTEVTGVTFNVADPETVLQITYRTLEYYVTYKDGANDSITQRFYTVAGHTGTTLPFHTVQIL